MCHPERRRFLGRLAVGGFLLTPLAATLSGCKPDGDWPDGMAEIKWDRDVCTRCSMVISDRRFAGEIRGGPKDTVFKFDDPGCLVFWLANKVADHPWLTEAATKIWIADLGNKPEAMKWLDPRQAYYVGKSSPMGYNFAAIAHPEAGSLDFESMRQHVLAKGR